MAAKALRRKSAAPPSEPLSLNSSAGAPQQSMDPVDRIWPTDDGVSMVGGMAQHPTDKPGLFNVSSVSGPSRRLDCEEKVI